jgi:ribonuclease P protein component
MKILGLKFKEVNKIRSGDNVRKFNTDLFTFIYHYDANFGCIMVVRKKLIKLAVTRNKIRRRIRSALSKGAVNCCVKCMIIAKKGVEFMDFYSISLNIDMFFQYISRKYIKSIETDL